MDRNTLSLRGSKQPVPSVAIQNLLEPGLHPRAQVASQAPRNDEIELFMGNSKIANHFRCDSAETSALSHLNVDVVIYLR